MTEMTASDSTPDRFQGEVYWLILRRSALIGTSILLSLILVACGGLRGGDVDDEFWSPFSSQSAWDVGDGRLRVELSGYERGHEPGRTAEFTIEIENRREVSTELEICAKLIDERQIVQRFDQFEMNLQPDRNQRTTFQAAFRDDIEPRAYGLAVVIGEIGAVIHTVRVGIPDDEAGPWLDADELVCD